jgi:hypothetical protein
MELRKKKYSPKQGILNKLSNSDPWSPTTDRIFMNKRLILTVNNVLRRFAFN